jgi:hypothetical protein
MSKAIVDPEDVRVFASSLLEMASRLQDGKAHVRSRFGALKGVWRDRKYGQFDQVFSETMTRMEQFLRYSELYAQYLKKKAEKAEVYQRARYR